MQRSVILTLALALLATPALAPMARGQITIDLRALDAVPPAQGQTRPVQLRPRPAPPPPAPPQAPAQAQAAPAQATPAQATPAQAAAPATPAPPAATLPIVTPPTATLPPIPDPTPKADATPPAPPPVAADATAKAAPAPAIGGMRVSFDAGATDLSPGSVAAIKEFIAAAPASDTASYNVVAYASGKADDPSTARRVSLSRAMAVRAALMADGVPSSRIYVRALGTQSADGPPDRVDISMLGGNGQGGNAARP